MKGEIEKNRQALSQLSRAELFEIEDALLLPRELSSKYRTRFSSGRIVTFVLALVYWGLLLLAMSRWEGWSKYGILTLIPFFGTFAIAIILSERTWRGIGVRGRAAIRTALHYWPLSIYLALQVAYIFRK